MGLYAKAKNSLSRGELLPALEFFELSFKNENLSLLNKVKVLYEIKNLLIVLDKNKDNYFLTFLAESFERVGRFEEAIDSYDELLKVSPCGINYIKVINLNLIVGNVNSARTCVDSYLHYLVIKRDFHSLLNYLDEIISDGQLIDDLSYFRWLTITHMQTGNVKAFEELLLKVSNSYENELLEIYILNTSHNSSYWHSNTTVCRWLLLGLVSSSYNDSLSKKLILKLLVDIFLVNKIDHQIIDNCITIAKKWHLNNFGYELAKYLGDKELENYFIILIPKEQMISEDYDLGTDLLSDEKIVDRALFSFSIGDNKSAQNYMTKVNNDELIKELKQAISPAHNNNYENDDQSDEFLRLLDYYEDSYLIDNYEDLIISFNMMRMFKVSIKLIERVRQHTSSKDEILNLDYLKAESLLAANNYFEARDLVEDILIGHILAKDQRLMFNYLRGECYYHLGGHEKSYKIFSNIKDQIKGYRLTEQWMSKIEKN